MTIDEPAQKWKYEIYPGAVKIEEDRAYLNHGMHIWAPEREMDVIVAEHASLNLQVRFTPN